MAEPRTLLVVEDEGIIRMALADDLRDLGYEVIEAGNAAEAIAALQAGARPDLVVTDVRMPGELDGLGLARWIAEHAGHLRVIVTSGHVQLLNPADQIPGVVGFIPKPYDPEHIDRRVRSLLG